MRARSNIRGLYLLRVFLALSLLLTATVIGCRGKGATQDSALAVVEALRFPHAKHSELACTSCHASDGTASGKTLRPGGDQHRSCAASECHESQFKGATTEFCALCHEELSTKGGDASSLVPFPPQSTRRSQAVEFSHLRHLDAAAMEERLGFHISCVDCHSLDSEGIEEKGLSRPSHRACARCHAAESAPDDTPTMGACTGCHQQSAEKQAPGSKLIEGDLRFSHQRHRNDRRGKLISCATCHLESVSATKEQAGQHAAPQMRICVACHDDEERVAQEQGMRQCQACHVTRSASLSALAPRSHLPATERPADHTQAFRRDHASDARVDAQKCARCHTMLSGNKRDTCDECHQVMPPRDHVITWREFDHGPEAATVSERCTTCHQVDFCVACHSKPPRSHFPIMEFRNGGHGTQAALNTRACLTCHNPDRDNSCRECHRIGYR